MNVTGFLILVAISIRACCHGMSVERVIGGYDADDAAFPYQVSLRTRNSHFCGGSVLNERWILTAGHCVDGKEAEDVVAVVGTNSLSTGGEPCQADELILHENYGAFMIKNDIGLIRVANDIVFGPKVQPIALPTADFTNDDYPAVLSGWGRISLPGNLPDALQEIKLLVISQTVCEASNWRATATNICTFTRQGQGACHGDSGGPLTADGVQIGIVSFGMPCAIGAPDVYTRVWSFREWIDKRIADKSNEESNSDNAHQGGEVSIEGL